MKLINNRGMKAPILGRHEVHPLRKMWHIGLGMLALWPYYEFEAITAHVLMVCAFSVGAVGLLLDGTRLLFAPVNRVVFMVFGPFMRKSEISSFSGLPFYALGIGSSLFLYEEKLAILSILFLIFSDPISSYFGIRYGTDRIIPNKSVQGAVAGLCTCYLISLIYGLVWVEPTVDLLLFSLLAGVAGAISELLSVVIDDNLTIPLVSGGVMTLLNALFQIY